MTDDIASGRAFSTDFTFIRHDMFSLQGVVREILNCYSYISPAKNASPFQQQAANRWLFFSAPRLFRENYRLTAEQIKAIMASVWRGYSSAGRALEWHSRGQRFDPA
jgi:hypothetical protein